MNVAVMLLLAVLAVLAWSGRFILGDWIAGVVFKAGGRFHVDDRVRFDGISGRLSHFGNLFVTLETDDGGSVDIPYSRLAKGGILEKKACGKNCITFSLTLVSDEPVSVIHSRLQAVILSAPWTSIVKPPRITLNHRADKSYAAEVTVHLIDTSFAMETETYVRKWMTGDTPQPS